MSLLCPFLRLFLTDHHLKEHRARAFVRQRGRRSTLCNMSHPALHIFDSHSVQFLIRHVWNNAIRDTGDQGTFANFRPDFGTQHFSLSSDSNFSLLLPSPWLCLVKPLWVACCSHESNTEGFTQAGFIELHYRGLYFRWPQCSQNNLSLLILPVTSLSIRQRRQ